MSQATTWSVPLVGPVTPPAFAGRIDESLDAALSSHSGSTRPSYAVAGTVWLSTATAGQHKYYFFDGTNDHLVLAINTATGAIAYSDGVSNDVLATLLPKTSGNALDLTIAPSAASTKKLGFGLTGITAGQTRVLTMPDRDVDLGKIGCELIGTVDLTGAASTAGAFLNLSASSYDQYKIEALAAVPATSGVDLYLENSVNNGGAYGATSDVNWRRSQQTTASTTIAGLQASADTKAIMVNNVSNTANLAGFEGSIAFYPNPGARTRAIWSASGHTGTQEFGGEGTAFFAASTNALRVRPSSGNWTSGRLNLYGIRH